MLSKFGTARANQINFLLRFSVLISIISSATANTKLTNHIKNPSRKASKQPPPPHKITSENWNDTGNNNDKTNGKDNWFPKCIKHCLDEANMCYLVNDICYTEEDKTHKEFDVRVMPLPASNIAWSGQKARKSHRGKGWKNWPSDVDRMKWINVLAVHLFFF